MILEIIKNTPIWVYVLFIALLVLGFISTKERTLTRARVSSLPIIMGIFSFIGVYSTPNAVPGGIILWGFGLAISTYFFTKKYPVKSAVFTPEPTHTKCQGAGFL